MNPQKVAVQQYWDARPCGSREPLTKSGDWAYFRAYERLRYGREPEIVQFAEFERWERRQVLEIGVGMGADFVQFKRAGATAVGIDLSSRSLALAQRNAEINGVTPALAKADTEQLPFPDNSFDLVYSWGVLHHTPDIGSALRQVHRVLKPGGEVRVMLYHRRSLVAAQCYLRYGLGRLRPFPALAELIATCIESPGTRAFTRAEGRFLFRDFREVEINPVVTAYDLRIGRRRFAPRWVLRMFPNQFGWFLLIRALK